MQKRAGVRPVAERVGKDAHYVNNTKPRRQDGPQTWQQRGSNVR